MKPLPEAILQFGGGNFLRAFADLFIDQANHSGQAVGRIVIVQSTDSGVAAAINAQVGRYHVLIRGLNYGQRVDEQVEVKSVSRALDAQTQWPAILSIAESQDLRYIISNTTEAGFTLSALDRVRADTGKAPVSFPAKLLEVLWARFHAASSTPPTILPTELLPKNGDRLHALVREQATLWNASPDLIAWLDNSCVWANSLVDRIVSGKPATHPLLDDDQLLTVAEPYASWVVEEHARLNLFTHPAIKLVADSAPYELCKVRILNAAHTALAAYAMPQGIVTVREAIEHPTVGPWLQRLLVEEILPTIKDRAPDAHRFIQITLERLANPFMEHKLSSIALNHAAKLQIRLAPTRSEYIARFSRSPSILDSLLEH